MKKKFKISRVLILFLSVFIFQLSIVSSSFAVAVTRFWIGSADSNFSNTNNWSNVSGGSTPASVPVSTDTAIFDSGGNNPCTINGTSVTLTNLTVTGTYTNTITEAANLYFLGAFTMAGGGGSSWNCGSSTISLAGNWTVSGGTFNSNTSLLKFVGGTTTISAAVPLYNLEFATSGSITMTGSVLTVINNLTFSGNGRLTFIGGAINAQKDITNSNIATSNGGATTVITISGSGDQLFTGNTGGIGETNGGLPATLVVNKTGGTLTLLNAIAPTASWTVLNTGAADINSTGATVVFGGNPFNVSGVSHVLANVEFSQAGSNAGLALTTSGMVLSISKNLNFTSTGNNSLKGPGTVEVQGNINITSLNPSMANSTILTMTVNGTTNQTITGNSTPNGGILPLLTINKPSGTLYLVNTISVQSWTYTAGTIDPTNSTVVFNSNMSLNSPTPFNNITLLSNSNIANPKTITLTGNLAMNGNLTIISTSGASNTLFNTGAFNVTIGGNWAHTSGTFNAGTGTVEFITASTPSTITGVNAFNIFESIAAGKSIFFDSTSPSVVSIANNLTLTGTAGSLITLRSTNDGTQWSMVKGAAGAANCSYVDVKDSNNSGTPIVMVNSVDSGNNIGWVTGTPPPVVSGLNPSTGSNSASTSLTITGSNLTGTTGVTLSDAANTGLTGVTVIDAGIIYASIPSGVAAGIYNVKATTPAGTNSTSSTKFTVTTAIPAVFALTPASGKETAATTISIAGTGFFGGLTSSTVTAVKISDGIPTALNITSSVITDTTITNAILPAGIVPGTYDIIVFAAGGNNVTSTQKFSVLPVPKVTGLSSLTGPNTLSNTITITGAGFFGGKGLSDVSSINLSDTGTTAITGFTVASDTQITGAVINSGIKAGMYDVRVTTSVDTNNTSAVKYTVTASAPTVISITPSVANLASATTVTITGTNFFGGLNSSNITSVKLDDGANTLIGTGAAVISNSEIDGAVVPSGILKGTYNVIVTTGGGSNTTSTIKYQVITPTPEVYTLTPSTGSNVNPVTIAITGKNFFLGGSNAVTAIHLDNPGNTLIPGGYTVADDSDITNAIIPAGTTAVGSYNVLVTTAGGTNTTSTTKFTISTSAPAVSSVTPAGNFDNTAARTLTITGSGFTGGVTGGTSTVTLVTVNGTTLTLPGTGTINATIIPGLIMPPGIPVGTYNIVVATTNGTGTGTNLVTIITGAPVISGVTPGGNFNNTAVSTLTISGSGFFGGAGSTSAVSGITVNGTALTIPGSGISNFTIPGVIMPSGIPSGTYNILVTTIGGTGTGTLLVTINTNIPQVTGLNPSTGPNNAATSITITGTGFFGGITSSTVTAVKLDNGTSLTGAVAVSDSIIYASVPSGITNGVYNVKVTAAGGTNSTSTVQFTIVTGNSTTAGANIPTGSGIVTIEVNPVTGIIQLIIDAGTFTDTMNITLTSNPSLPVVDRTTVVPGLGLSITEDKSLQPVKLVKIVVNYRDADVVGLDESKLKIARYDEVNKRWIILATTVFADANRLEAYTDHLSTFGIIQLIPAIDLKLAKPYPNPFTPGAGASLTFDAVTTDAKVTIYTIMGEKVVVLTDVDKDGRIVWDGRNAGGSMVATGIYMAVVQNPREAKRLKIAVQR